MKDNSYLAGLDSSYIEWLYEKYRTEPESLSTEWQKFFEGFDFAQSVQNGSSKSSLQPIQKKVPEKEVQVSKLIDAYRCRGHLKSRTNPIRPRRKRKAYLDYKDFGLNENDLDQVFQAGTELGIGPASLKDILARLERIYLGTIGFEYHYIRDLEIRNWIQKKIEQESISFELPIEDKKRILYKLNEAVVFENFLHSKYIGQKRFSLEGGENLIPALDRLLEKGSELGGKEMIIGMAHRGRLNVLTNILRKTYDEIFHEFEGVVIPDMAMGSGDVKYHLGFANQIQTQKGKTIIVELAPNPSHLESINPVVQGYVRAKATMLYDKDYTKVIPILIHGDAAIAGQGITYEIAQMSQLVPYKIGGTIHIIVNNQLGFTTDYYDARSSTYCSDIAKIIDAPVFRVNGDDPEAVIFAVDTAVEYRQTFQKDIFIDILCYRRYGHNEGDEPRFTQPTLYQLIAKHPNPREVYNKNLIERGDLGIQIVKTMDREFRKLLQERLNWAKEHPLPYKAQKFEKKWDKLRRSLPEDFFESPETQISHSKIEKIAHSLTTLPEGFSVLKQIQKLMEERKKLFYENKALNWACAELMAYGSLTLEGKRVRICGQDTERGTFSHRHAVLHDFKTNKYHSPLDNLAVKQEKFKVYNSLLSEYGALGFELGYSLANPDTLTIWEAQFGDFVNGAQVIIDQFITTCESKWQRMSGLVLLLPHGYEGQGPEHSSARLERFLQQGVNGNIVVVNLTTPANFFHAIRRQLAWPFRKPLIVMSPKSLLRHPLVISPLEDFTQKRFQEIIDDSSIETKNIQRVLICSGKIYYDLLERKVQEKRKDIALIRIEQLYPFPERAFQKIIQKYNGAEFFWVQEEPHNMGAWTYLNRKYPKYPWNCISRKESSSTAVGYLRIHNEEQQQILNQAFGTSETKAHSKKEEKGKKTLAHSPKRT